MGKPSTVPAPDESKGGTLMGPNIIIAFLEEPDTVHRLPSTVKQVIIGSSSTAAIVINDVVVSRKHCRVERRDRRRESLWVVDLDSKNGTYFCGERQAQFSIRPGQVFMLGSDARRLLALNEQMLKHLPELQYLLCTLIERDRDEQRDEPGILTSTPPTPTPSELIALAVGNCSRDMPTSLLIVAERNSQQLRLARIIHELSRLRERPVVVRTAAELPNDRKAQIELVGVARRSTLILDLGEAAAPIDPDFVALLEEPRSQVRTVVLAGSREIAARALGRAYEASLAKIRLRPIAERTLAIDRLLDHTLEEHNSPLRMASLTAENQESLRANGWPENWEGLRRAAVWLTAIYRHGTIHAAALAIGVSPATMSKWYSRSLGLTLPLCRGPNR